MSIVYTDNTNYTNIANAIRNKGVNGTFKPSEMASAIASIPSGVTPSGEISITENGTFDVTNYASALVNVAGGGDIILNGEASEKLFGIYYNEITQQENANNIIVTHNLNSNNIILAVIWATDINEEITNYNQATLKLLAPTNYNQYGTASVTYNALDVQSYYDKGLQKAVIGTITNTNYLDEIVDNNTIKFNQSNGSTHKFYAGIKYRVLIVARRAVSEG